MTPSGVISLLTDFGVTDPYVGILRAVILREAPHARVIDLTHGIAPQQVEQAAFYLQHSFQWFPTGTVHLCVVDPGVGSARAALAVSAHGHFFVAPDNGLLSGVLSSGASEVRAVDAQALGLIPASRTFHGRDLFAPVAARLASSARTLSSLGGSHSPKLLDWSAPKRAERAVSGTVRVVDHFGNLITDIPGKWLQRRDAGLHVAGRRLRLVQTYADAKAGECVGLISSFETVEIAQRDGSAAKALGIGVHANIEIELSSSEERAW